MPFRAVRVLFCLIEMTIYFDESFPELHLKLTPDNVVRVDPILRSMETMKGQSFL